MAKSLANSWKDAELYYFENEAEALDVDSNVFEDFAYALENDPAGAGFEGPLMSFEHFINMPIIMLVDIIITMLRYN